MSLLKWKELAKSKSQLGNKINFIHETILKNKLGETTSEASYEKVFKPITKKLDDVIVSNLRTPRRRKHNELKKDEVPDYGIPIDDDDLGDFDIANLYDDNNVEKQIVPKPPSYEESLEDLIEGKKKIYMNPDYDYDEGPDYAVDTEDEYEENVTNGILVELKLPNYDDIQIRLNQPEIITDANIKINQLKGIKGQITHKNKRGEITEEEKLIKHKRIDVAFLTVKEYIKHYQNKLKTTRIWTRWRRIRWSGSRNKETPRM